MATRKDYNRAVKYLTGWTRKDLIYYILDLNCELHELQRGSRGGKQDLSPPNTPPLIDPARLN